MLFGFEKRVDREKYIADGTLVKGSIVRWKCKDKHFPAFIKTGMLTGDVFKKGKTIYMEIITQYPSTLGFKTSRGIHYINIKHLWE